jgi:hypothetical protein
MTDTSLCNNLNVLNKQNAMTMGHTLFNITWLMVWFDSS